MRQPPPRGIRPSFLMSTCTSSPGAGHLDASDRSSGRPVEVVEAVEPVSHQHRMDRRRRHPHDPRDAGRAQAPLAAQVDDPPLPRRLGACRVAVRAAGAILEPRNPFRLVPASPDVGAVPGDPHRLGRVSDRTAASIRWHSGNRPAGVRRALRCTRASVRVGCSATPTLARRLSSSVDPCQQGPWALQLAGEPEVGPVMAPVLQGDVKLSATVCPSFIRLPD